MKKAGVILVVILLASLTAGCIGGKSATGTNHSPQGKTSSGNITASSTASPKSQQYSVKELLDNIREIHQFSFLENTSIELNVTAGRGNSTQSENVTIIYHRKGYIDLTGRRADVNATTLTLPGGASLFTRSIIIGKEFYLFIGGRWIKLTNKTVPVLPDAFLNMTWKYNIVNFTERYLQKKPFKATFENRTQLLYYNITEEDLKAIAEAFLGNNANMTFNVTRGILELRFRNGVLIGGRMGYHMTVHTWGEAVGRMVDIYETGNVYDEFVVFDINVRKRVSPPELERA